MTSISYIRLCAVAALIAVAAAASAQVTALSFRPVAAEYSQQLDRIIMISANPNQLHIYNAAANADLTVALAKAPLAISVSPDGLHAAIAHDSLVSYVNLSSAAVERTYPVSATGQSISLGAAYAYTVGNQVPLTSINLSSGATSTLPPVYTTGGRLHPSGLAIYGTDGSYLQRFDTSTGPAASPTDARPYGYAACGSVWFSPDGSRIYNGCGTIARYSTDAKLDMTYVTSFHGVQSIAALSESASAKRIAVISNATAADSEVLLFDSDALAPVGRFSLTDFIVGTRTYKAHGKWVFFNNAGTLYSIVEADLTSGLLNDFAIQAIPLNSPSPCSATFVAVSATAPFTGSYGSVGITAAQDCIFQAASNADWIVLTGGAYGSGNATLTYLVRPNPSQTSRTGTISMAGQTLTITQDAAAASPAAFNRLAYKIVDAEYSKSLDKLVFVTAAPNELHLLDPITQSDQFVPLPNTPYSVSVAPDGLKAAVGEDGSIAYVNLQTVAIEKTLQVSADARDVVLAGNGFVYAFSSRQSSNVYSVEIATGNATATSVVFPGLAGRLHPSGNYLYVAGRDWPSKWDISAGTAALISPAANVAWTCGNLWITETGDRIFTACGMAYNTSQIPAQDLITSSALSNATNLQWAAHSAVRSSTVVIPSGNTASDTELQMYGDVSLTYAGHLTLPRFTTAATTYAGHGRFVFWNSSANKLIVVEQADSAANLQSDFATYVISASTCPVTLSPDSTTAPYAGSVGATSVTAAGDCIWFSSTATPWLSISAGTVGLGAASLSYTAAANTTMAQRTGSITISDKTLTVIQAAAPVTLNPTSASVGSAATTGTITVTAGSPTYAWTAASSASWLTITSGATGTGNGQVSYSVAANTSQKSRTAVLTIAGLPYTVTQAGVPLVFTFTPSTPYSIPSVAGNWFVSVLVSANDAQYSATSNSPWITTNFPTLLTGNSQLSFAVTANTGNTDRTGSLTIGNATYTIVQRAPAPLTVTPAAGNLPGDWESGRFSVYLPTPVSWTAVSNAAWITINYGASGTSSGDVTFTAAPNGTGAPRTGTITVNGQVFTLTQAAFDPTAKVGLGFIPIAPCRIVDTRGESGQTGPFGPPVMTGGESRAFPIPTGACGIPATAQAYSVNVTVVPQEPLGYLTLWPSGQPVPLVSTLNSLDGRIVANGAIVPAGANGSISAYVTNKTHVVIDVNGYFDPLDPNGLGGGAGLPCRLVDTRSAASALGGPALAGYVSRTFPLQTSNCFHGASPQPYVPGANAYWVNATVVPAEPLGYLSLWPGGGPQPYVSTLNSLDGGIVANAAIVPRGPAEISAMTTGRTDLVLDLIGYFNPLSRGGGGRFYPVTPCRLVDTRLQTTSNGVQGGPSIAAKTERSFQLMSPACGVPPVYWATASINLTVVPKGPALGYLTVWTGGNSQPLTSNLNSPKGRIVSNSAIVWLGDFQHMSVYSTDDTDLVVDLNGYFAP